MNLAQRVVSKALLARYMRSNGNTTTQSARAITAIGEKPTAKKSQPN